MKPLRIGTRGSALALWQANFISGELRTRLAVSAEIVVIKTTGDKFQSGPLGEIGMKGVFIKELEDALLANQIDLAVHSMKDVPTELPPGLKISAITRRADARDCIVSREGQKLMDLAQGARVGTSSLRRQSQLRHRRRDLDVRDVRGNVDTRLKKLDAGEYDAIVLAIAGLERLGFSARATEILEPDVMLPAVGQGALGIETRADDAATSGFAREFDDEETRACVDAERSLLAELQGGCQVPLGAWARIEEGSGLKIDAAVLSVDGTQSVRGNASGAPSNAQVIGRGLGRQLLTAGADKLLEAVGRAVTGPKS